MSRATLGGRVAACARAGGSAGSVVKSLILGLPAPREARARNTTPTASATAPPRPRPRPRAAWMTLVTPTTTPVSPPSPKSTKATSPRTIPSQASAGPITKSAPAITPKALSRPAPDVLSSMAPPRLVDALLLPGPFPLAQRVLLHLAGRGLRQRTEGDRPRALEVCEYRAAVGDDVGLRRRPSLLEHDERLRHLAPLRVRHGDHRHLEHVGVARDRLLDLDGRDVLAARDDDVLLAVAQRDVAVGVHDGHVAGVEPAAAEGLGGG